MLVVNSEIQIPLHEIEFVAIRSQGSGGQHVNKVSTAIHLRFDIRQSSLKDSVKARLNRFNDDRISKEGIIVIKAQVHRSLVRNKQEALERLADLIRRANTKSKFRVPTKPSRAVKKKRLQNKSLQSLKKKMRGKPKGND